ncbi:MAG: hypothetical protein M1823_004884 [Watsoniomyces obsoletus]|nr:MAG: hypothetical protein M1823_004884 [Watsoniomyces obsoletus]
MTSIPIDPVLLRSLHPEPLGQATSDDEWEYEYDEHKTDTFYLTLDLTSTRVSSRKRKRNHRKRRVPDSDESSGEFESSESSEDEQDNSEEEYEEEEETQEEPTIEPSPLETMADNRVQILDLHAMHPLVTYHNRIYRCTWASNLGTELLFTQPTTDGGELPALRSAPDYTLLAASSSRLMAQSARMSPRKRPRMGESSFFDFRLEGQSLTRMKPIPLGDDSLPERHRQARFLEELMDIKDERGEEDEVTINIINPTVQARHQRFRETQQIRQERQGQSLLSEEEDDEDSEDDSDESSEESSEEDYDPAEEDMYVREDEIESGIFESTTGLDEAPISPLGILEVEQQQPYKTWDMKDDLDSVAMGGLDNADWKSKLSKTALNLREIQCREVKFLQYS